MGTKVHSKSFFPGHYSMMNLNEDIDSGSWPLYYGDKILKGRQCYDSFSPQPARDLYSENDKEVVKQTMLKHEAIFRNQVSELHRLYRMQRVLMEDLKRQEVHKYPIAVEASHSNAVSSQKASEDAKKMCFIPSVPSVKSACSMASVSVTENMWSHVNFAKQSSMKADSFPTQNGRNLGDCNLMESKNRKLSRRMFDLELPADEYIDSEEGDQIEDENASQASVVTNHAFKRNWGVSPENDRKLFVGADAKLNCQGGVSNSVSCLGNKSSLADLNQPIQVEEASSLASVNNFLGPVIYHGGIQGTDASLKQNSAFLGFPGEIFHSTQRADKGEESRQEWSPYKLQSGQNGTKMNSFSQDFAPERLPSTSKTVKIESKDARVSPTYLLPDNNRSATWSGNTDFGSDASERSRSIVNHNLWGPVAALPMSSQYLVVPDVSNSVSLSASSMRRPTSSLSQDPDAVKGMHCFNPSALSSKSSNASIQNPKFIEGKWHLNNHLQPNSSLGSEASCRSGLLHGSLSESNASQARFPLVSFDYLNCSSENNSAIEHSDNHHSTKYFKGSGCKDVKSRKDMNLNLELPSGSQGEMIALQDTLVDGERKNDDSLRALPWLRNKPTPIQDSASASSTHIAEDYRSEKYDCLGTRKIFGVPIIGKPNNFKDLCSQNLSERGVSQNGGKVVLNIDLSEEPALSDSGQQLSMENAVIVKETCKGPSGSRVHLDLNSCASEEEPLECFIPKETVKITSIDLEVPLVPETAEAILPEKYVENEFKMPTQSSQGGLQDPSKELVKVAAEALVIISSSEVHNHSRVDSCQPPEVSVSESLYWFAEMVSSHAGVVDSEEGITLKGKGSFEFETYSSDESGYFERMTLNLTETKMDEEWCKPHTPENLKKEETVGLSLPTRRRRGQARRGRQRKDFQRDILPGIASLSRHEVTEDLQTIGGLMRATGHPWQTALERRNAARNGWARGRRRSRGGGAAVPSVAAVAACFPTQQQLDNCSNNNNNNNNNSNNNELGVEERSLKGWGKTTRRPRCQRFVAGILLQSL